MSPLVCQDAAAAVTPHPPVLTEPLDERSYREIKQELSFERHYGATLGLQALDALLFGLGLWLVNLHRIDAWISAQLLFTLVFWHGFAILHDCGHSAAAKSRTLNTLSGVWASLFCFMPYYSWKLVHQQHHQWTGHLDRDPTARGLARWKQAGKIPMWIRIAWWTWVPAAALFQHLVLWSYPIELARTHGLRDARVLRCALSVAILPAAYGIGFALLPELMRLSTFAGALVLYLGLTELINLPHHSDMPFGFRERLRPWQQWRTARSCAYPKLVSVALLLNFNLHVEHHLFPSLPWYRLGRVRERVRPLLGKHYVEAKGAAWNLLNRRRDLESVLLSPPAAPSS